MDWLRSEDLKEEKNVTTPVIIKAGESGLAVWCCHKAEQVEPVVLTLSNTANSPLGAPWPNEAVRSRRKRACKT